MNASCRRHQQVEETRGGGCYSVPRVRMVDEFLAMVDRLVSRARRTVLDYRSFERRRRDGNIRDTGRQMTPKAREDLDSAGVLSIALRCAMVILVRRQNKVE
jgi:hypothetical protein